MKEKVKGFKILIVCIIVSLVILIGNSIVTKTVYNKRLVVKSNENQNLTSQIEKNRVLKSQSLDNTKAQITGIDMNRVRTDDGVAEAFLKKIFTWSSAEEYNNIRDDLVNSTFVQNENFLSTLFPELKIEQDVEGNDTNIIDDNIYGQLNMKYDSMTSHVTEINGTTYSYFTEVIVTSEVSDGTSRIGNIVVTYSVDKDGNILNLNAYIVAE